MQVASKYILIILLLSTQLFAYEKNKPITLYGDVSEHLVHSSLTNKKENYYILNAYNFNNKGIKTQPLQLIFDNKTKLTIPKDQLSQRYRVKGVILGTDYKDKRYVTHQVFKVNSIRKARERLKVKSYLNNSSYVKLMVDSPMIGKIDAKKRKVDIDYITNIKVKADNKLLYNVNLSPCIKEDPLLKFSYTNIKPHSLTLEYTDNNVSIGTVGRKTKKVIYKNKINQVENQLPKQIKLSEDPKKYPNQIESIKNIFGDIILIEDGIELTTPKFAENPTSILLKIRSDIKFKSIALFLGIGTSQYYPNSYIDIKKSNIVCGEEDGYSFVSQWFSTPYSLVNFDVRIKMRYDGEVLVILEAENGKFYTVRKQIEVWKRGDNCS